MPDNRQLALAIWVAVGLGFALARRGGRRSIADILRTLWWKLALLLVGLAGWTIAATWVGRLVGLWTPDLVADTVFWFVTAGFVLFGKFAEVGKTPNTLRKAALGTLEATVLIQGVMELFVLGLVAELLLQPIFAVLGMTVVVAAQKPEYRSARRLIEGAIVVASVALAAYVLTRLATGWDELDKVGLVRKLFLPVWLTAGVVPYIYVVGVVSAYESAFIRIDFKSSFTAWQRRRAKLAMIVAFGFRARRVATFTGPWQYRLASAESWRDARRVIADFRRDPENPYRATD